MNSLKQDTLFMTLLLEQVPQYSEYMGYAEEPLPALTPYCPQVLYSNQIIAIDWCAPWCAISETSCCLHTCSITVSS